MPYVTPRSCPPIGHAPALVIALYVLIMLRAVEDLQFAAELMEGGPDYYQQVKGEVLQRTNEHTSLMSMYMRPFLRIREALSDPAA